MCSVNVLGVLFLDPLEFCLFIPSWQPGYPTWAAVETITTDIINPIVLLSQKKLITPYAQCSIVNKSVQHALCNQLQDIVLAGVDLQHEASKSSSSSMLIDPASTRLHPISSSSGQHLHSIFSPSPQAATASYVNGVASSENMAMEEDNKLDHESHLQRLTSPIIADLPLISMRSPPLSLDFAASEVRMIDNTVTVIISLVPSLPDLFQHTQEKDREGWGRGYIIISIPMGWKSVAAIERCLL